MLFSILFAKVTATSQEPDKIILNNKEYDLLNNPLEKYFELHPEDHPIYSEKNINRDKNGEKSIPPSLQAIIAATLQLSRLKIII